MTGWQGDLNDDCILYRYGLYAHVECLARNHWWFAVGRGEFPNYVELYNTAENRTPVRLTTGKTARAAAEAERRAREAGDKEAQRQAAEAKRKADEEAQARAKAEAAAHEKAQSAVDNGAASAEKAQLEAAASIAAPAMVETKLAGNTMRDNWIAKLKPNVTEDQARNLIAAECAARPELAAFLKLDMAAINRGAKTYKQAMNVPGFEAKNERIAAGSRK